MQPSIDTGAPSGPFGRPDPSLPQVFGRYLLVQRLSRGGMGEIFLAKHGLEGFEKLAVIKKVLPHLAADAQFISRFVDEAQVAIKLSHVNVAQVFEVGRVGDEYFLALEYIDGRDLRRTLGQLSHRRRRMPVDLALFVARELANGLAYAHRRTTSDGASLNLVHCDISPPNVLVSFEGETKVIDFGIAKSVMRETATDPKVGFGKFGYMAPEQLIRGGVVDFRTDLYAAGVVLFELLTNTRLYESGPEPDYRALAKKVSRGEHPLPSDIDRSLAIYDNLVAIALRPKVEDRYQSAAELRDAIQQCLVAVNPTISTDQLGAYMRDLFADEMAAQRELHERVASARLSDFQAQFHTQTISTVSFALAQLPEATGKVGRTPPSQLRSRNRASGGNAVVSQQRTPSAGHAQIKPSPALDTMSPPTGAIDRLSDDELDPAATIVRIAPPRNADASTVGRLPEISPLSLRPEPHRPEPRQMPEPHRPEPRQMPELRHMPDPAAMRRGPAPSYPPPSSGKRRALIIGLCGAIVIVSGFAIGRVAGGSKSGPRPPRRPIATSLDQSSIVVEPIPVEPITVEPLPVAPSPAAPGSIPPDPGAVAPDPAAVPPTNPGAVAPATDPGVAPGSAADPGAVAPGAAPTEIEMAPEDTARGAAAPARPRTAAHASPRPAPVAPVPFTRELLGQKFQQVRREYDDYKAKFGARLEKEWGELATFIQYMPHGDGDDDAGRKEAARRLDAFRGRMRE